jgi:hypothetical protein
MHTMRTRICALATLVWCVSVCGRVGSGVQSEGLLKPRHEEEIQGKAVDQGDTNEDKVVVYRDKKYQSGGHAHRYWGGGRVVAWYPNRGGGTHRAAVGIFL